MRRGRVETSLMGLSGVSVFYESNRDIFEVLEVIGRRRGAKV